MKGILIILSMLFLGAHHADKSKNNQPPAGLKEFTLFAEWNVVKPDHDYNRVSFYPNGSLVMDSESLERKTTMRYRITEKSEKEIAGEILVDVQGRRKFPFEITIDTPDNMTLKISKTTGNKSIELDLKKIKNLEYGFIPISPF